MIVHHYIYYCAYYYCEITQGWCYSYYAILLIMMSVIISSIIHSMSMFMTNSTCMCTLYMHVYIQCTQYIHVYISLHIYIYTCICIYIHTYVRRPGAGLPQ